VGACTGTLDVIDNSDSASDETLRSIISYASTSSRTRRSHRRRTEI